jgi:hypothetical protein
MFFFTGSRPVCLRPGRRQTYIHFTARALNFAFPISSEPMEPSGTPQPALKRENTLFLTKPAGQNGVTKLSPLMPRLESMKKSPLLKPLHTGALLDADGKAGSTSSPPLSPISPLVRRQKLEV